MNNDEGRNSHGHTSDTDTILSDNGIDPALSRWVLDKVRSMDRGNSESDQSKQALNSSAHDGIPDIPGGSTKKSVEWSPHASNPRQQDNAPGSGESLHQIMDISRPETGYMDIPRSLLASRIAMMDFPGAVEAVLKERLGLTQDDTGNDTIIRLEAEQIRILGLALLPRVSYGVLNGGSATSYADEKKNHSFNSELFQLYHDHFQQQAKLCRGKAKGITPAYLNPDGTPGVSFMELKIRAALLLAREHYQEFPASSSVKSDNWGLPLFPLFQMTSSGNDGEISRALDSYASSPLIAPLLRELGIKGIPVESGIQPLISALEHSEQLTDGHERDFFLKAWGKEQNPLALPGGHGQNFFALEHVYKKLQQQGKRYAYLGNVDNLAYLPDPLEIGLTALTTAPAGFDFSFKTDVDVKGGVLLKTRSGGLSCGDIGPAVSRKTVEDAEHEGKAILFNCATGLFDLDYLTRNLSRIQDSLPLRVSDQDKDAGRYSQAEQVTWEVMSLIEGFLAFGVDKFDRFLAGKLLVENMLTSGLLLDDPDFPETLHDIGNRLHRGFRQLMHSQCGMVLHNGRWGTRESGN